MSETDNLKLYKADPITDGDKTFNIDTMLNNNWDKIDAAVQGVKDDVSNIDLSKITPESIGAETPAGAQEKANAAAAASVPRAGDVRKNGQLTIDRNADALNLVGIDHVYQTFWTNNERKGYIGASDPANPDRIVISADRNNLMLYSAGRIFLNDRDVNGELDQLKTSGVEAKKAIVDAIIAQGGQASTADTWEVLAQKIRNIQQGLANTFLLRKRTRYQPIEFSAPPIMVGSWEKGFISGQSSAPASENVNIFIRPEDGWVSVQAGNLREKSAGQVIMSTPVDLTNVDMIEFTYRPQYYSQASGYMMSLGVIKNKNPNHGNYDVGFTYDVGNMGNTGFTLFYNARLDTSALTGTYYIGMTVENRWDNEYKNAVLLEGVLLIQNPKEMLI